MLWCCTDVNFAVKYFLNIALLENDQYCDLAITTQADCPGMYVLNTACFMYMCILQLYMLGTGFKYVATCMLLLNATYCTCILTSEFRNLP